MVGFCNTKCYLTKLLDFILGAWFTVFETMKHWQFDILIGGYVKIPVTQLKQDLVLRYWVCYLVKAI